MNLELINSSPANLAPAKVSKELEIQLLLEWAGTKILSLPIQKPKPKSYLNNWPDYFYDYFPNSFSGSGLRPESPNNLEIDLIDEILTLVLLISNPLSRKIIQSRLLINPITLKHIYTWSKISQLLNLSPYVIKNQYQLGINQIIKNSNPAKIKSFLSKIN